MICVHSVCHLALCHKDITAQLSLSSGIGPPINGPHIRRHVRTHNRTCGKWVKYNMFRRRRDVLLMHLLAIVDAVVAIATLGAIDPGLAPDKSMRMVRRAATVRRKKEGGS